ncbi:MAG: c-type cytochrome, partial [Polyangiaceae bacterium]
CYGPPVPPRQGERETGRLEGQKPRGLGGFHLAAHAARTESDASSPPPSPPAPSPPSNLLTFLFLPLLSLSLVTTACQSPPSASSLQEWTPQDHHSSDDNKGGGGGASGQQAPAGKAAPGTDVPQLVDLTWRQQCTTCHGSMGKGDGQMGPMLHAPDLTDPALQAKASDAELAAIIKGGRDKMPAFNLPDPVLQGLVARIRQLKGR